VDPLALLVVVLAVGVGVGVALAVGTDVFRSGSAGDGSDGGPDGWAAGGGDDGGPAARDRTEERERALAERLERRSKAAGETRVFDRERDRANHRARQNE
jgi:hypothetical protein